jgi:glycosyltransferase involved in cell wall biosynthesis
LAKTSRPDLVVAQYGTFTGLLVALFAPRPIVITYRGSDLNPTPSENRLYVLLKHLASHIASFFADGIVCVSSEVAGRLRCRKPVEIIPSSTDTDLFRPMDRDKCREELGWDLKAPTALFISGDDPGKKRLDMAEEVSQLIAGNSDGILMRIVRERLQISQVPLYLNAADCLVYLSDFEGSPNLIREACACATPVVTVPVGDVREVLDGVAPSTIVERDARKIADAVMELSRLQLRSNGRDKALCYSNEATAQKALEFYKKIVSRATKAH